MSFRELEIKVEYRSKIDNVAKEFYYPILKEAITYDRAVGFFSSTALTTIAQGLLPFVNNGGKIRIIASPKLSQEDIDAIEQGYKARKEVIEEAFVRELYSPDNFVEQERLNLLSKLIEDSRLDIRLALVGKYGMYHEKMGVFTDEEKNIISFSGSMNETYTAMSINYESIDVYKSWGSEDADKRARNKKEAFEKLWFNQDSDVEVLDYIDVNKEVLLRYKSEKQSYDEFDEECFKIEVIEEQRKKDEVGIPENIQLHDYQIRAIDTWRGNNYIGMFDMATGTGKTFTGIGAICELYKDVGQLAVIVVCPQTHLVEQWVEELGIFGIHPVVAYGIGKYKDYPIKARKAVFEYNLGVKKFICIICTKDTFTSAKLQEHICKIKQNICLLVDEAHNMGARSYLKYLTEQYDYRLALSATFERHHDEEGTQSLYKYFGKKCIEYSLEQAIDEEKLTKYKYYPILVELTPEELEAYNAKSEEIIKNGIIVDKKGKRQLSEYGKQLAIARSRIIAGARNKIEALVEAIDKYKNDKHILVYCGATSYGDEENDEEIIRQIDMVTRKLGLELGMKVAQFTSRENAKTREQLKNEFADGSELQALVAIKCLDEGVNIPAIKTAFILASTTNPKEYIQRRGRVLRLYPGKEYAEIYDFVTLPHNLDSIGHLCYEEMKYDKSLVKSELRRIQEFQRLSDNFYDSMELIQRMKEAYGLYEEGENEDELFEEY